MSATVPEREPRAWIRVLRALYRSALRLYPQRVRELYGAEQWEVTVERARELPSSSLAVARFWLRELVALLRSVRTARRDERRRAARGRSRTGGGALLLDARFVLRSLRARPGYAALAVLALALGIGANTALFSIARGVFLRPLPVAGEERLVAIWELNVGQSPSGDRWEIAPGDLEDYRRRNRAFEGIGGHEYPGIRTLRTDGGPVVLRSLGVTENLFDVLGVSPVLGRTFRAGDADPGRVVLLSHRLWTGRFGSDPDVVGRTIDLDGEPFEVVGVLAAGFYVQPVAVDLWQPVRYSTDELPFSRTFHAWYGVGRLRRDRTVEEGRRDLLRIARELEAELPETNAGHLVDVEPLRRALFGASRRPLILVSLVVGFVLLIACANVASMALTRMGQRRDELAIRSALGAGSCALARTALLEIGILAATGGLVGVVLASLVAPAALRASPLDLPAGVSAEVDPGLLLFGVGLGLTAGVGVAAAPLVAILRRAARASGRRVLSERSWGQRVLLFLQVALTVILLCGAGVLLRSLHNLRLVDPGFDSSGILTGRVTLPPADYPEMSERRAFFERLLEQVRALPGVSAASAATVLPIEGGGYGSALSIEGEPDLPNAQKPTVRVGLVETGLLRALGVPVLAGRPFDERDHPDAAAVVMINATAADRHFGGDAVGRRIGLGPSGALDYEIVGVVGDVRERGLRQEPLPTVYLPISQNGFRSLRLVIRTRGEPHRLVGPVESELAALDRGLPFSEVRTMREVADDTLDRERSLAVVLNGFAALAMLLSGLGVYGTMSLRVVRRIDEIGVRMALGADRWGVLRGVLAESATVVVPPVLAGLLLASIGNRALAGVTFEVSPADPITLVAVAAGVLTLALVAGLPAAWRAARVDPARSLQGA